MHIISILGLFTLLGIAWLLSYHKTKIRLKPILWGVGLQFLFALIILRNDKFSFIGMGILGILIVTYILQKDDQKLGSGYKAMIIVVLGSIAVWTLFYLLHPTVSQWVLILSLIFLIVNSIKKFYQPAQRYAGVLFVISGIAFLVTHGFHGQVIFKGFSDKIAGFLSLSDYGAKFLFSNLADNRFFGPWVPDFPNAGTWPGFGFQFGFKVLPTIIFFGGFMSVLYHLGIMQKVIEAMSKFMRWTIGTSGAETLSCSANIFVGQTEAPLLIKPFLNKMTKSELLTVMVGGFATIAGGVLAGYISMGIPAGHLIAASVMSAPAALVVGKIIFPEREHSQTAGDVALPKIKVGDNVIEAAANGITDGLKLAVNVGAMLIGFIALIAVIDVILNYADLLIDGKFLKGDYIRYAASGMSPAIGEFRGIIPGSLQTFFGTLLRPLAWMMGVPWEYADKVGNLLGIKLSLNEFVAYGTLGAYINDGILSQRAITIATYALCGFANFSSIGIQLGGISALAPNRKSDLAKIGLKAMFGGAIASFMTATIAGFLIN